MQLYLCIRLSDILLRSKHNRIIIVNGRIIKITDTLPTLWDITFLYKDIRTERNIFPISISVLWKSWVVIHMITELESILEKS